jgi:hypothetical protein
MSIALSLGNNLTTGGIFKPAAVNNTSVNNVTDFAGIAGGGTLVLLSTQTASASANISFTTGIDSTYDEYIFKFIKCTQLQIMFLLVLIFLLMVVLVMLLQKLQLLFKALS